MAIAEIASMLILEFGPVIGRKIWASINQTSNSDKLSTIAEQVHNGANFVSSFKVVFGENRFNDILNSCIGEREIVISFEAGTIDYIELQVQKGIGVAAKIEILRNEININIERVSGKYEGRTDVLPYFRGIFSKWISRYKKFVGENENVSNAQKQITELLDGSNRSWKEVYGLLKVSFGMMGALSIIAAVFTAMGIGAGIIGKISIILMGIPGGQVAGFALLGTVLLYLSTIKFENKHAINTCIRVAYKLLDVHS
jgi:hypothetical protein